MFYDRTVRTEQYGQNGVLSIQDVVVGVRPRAPTYKNHILGLAIICKYYRHLISKTDISYQKFLW